MTKEQKMTTESTWNLTPQGKSFSLGEAWQLTPKFYGTDALITTESLTKSCLVLVSAKLVPDGNLPLTLIANAIDNSPDYSTIIWIIQNSPKSTREKI